MIFFLCFFIPLQPIFSSVLKTVKTYKIQNRSIYPSFSWILTMYKVTLFLSKPGSNDSVKLFARTHGIIMQYMPVKLLCKWMLHTVPLSLCFFFGLKKEDILTNFSVSTPCCPQDLQYINTWEMNISKITLTFPCHIT